MSQDVAGVEEAIRKLSGPIPGRITDEERGLLSSYVARCDDLLIKPVLDVDPIILKGEKPEYIAMGLAEKGQGRCDTVGPYRHVYESEISYRGDVYEGPRTLTKVTKLLQSDSYVTVTGRAVPVVNGEVVEGGSTEVDFKICSLQFIKGKNAWGGLWAQSVLYRNWYRIASNAELKTVKNPPADTMDWDEMMGTVSLPSSLVFEAVEDDEKMGVDGIDKNNLTAAITTLLTRIAARYRSDRSADPPTRPMPLSSEAREALISSFPSSSMNFAAPELTGTTTGHEGDLLSYCVLHEGCPTTLEYVEEEGAEGCYLIGAIGSFDDEVEFIEGKVEVVEKKSEVWKIGCSGGVAYEVKVETDSSSESESEVEEKKKKGKRKIDEVKATVKRKWQANSEKSFARPQEMFDDMAQRVKDLWGEEFSTLKTQSKNGSRIRVATMCSGTEAPLLALNMFQRAFGFEFFEHVFSCEIEPFKQAYIERNFSPKILFRDIRELGNSTAHTAYGGSVPVPGNIDILIAGTVCKDFSNLNKFKKGLEDEGQSGMTFRGMLGWVRNHQPKVVILENVSIAPWGEIVDSFDSMKLPNNMQYKAKHIKVDTKRHYIPQTRERGYLCAVLGKKGVEDWAEGVRMLECFAAPNVTEFLLKTDDPMVVRARRKIIKKRDRKDVNWQRCELRHAKERATHKLGQQRPLTKWDGKGHLQPIDWFWHDWLANLTERVHDTIEIRYLKTLSENDDALFRTTIWNLACNVDRGHCGRNGVVPCLTPTMIPFITSRGGPLIGAEALSLQGIPVDDLILTQETEKQLKDLAGNAMTTTVVGSCIMSAMMTVLGGGGKKRRKVDVKPEDDSPMELTRDMIDQTKVTQLPTDIDPVKMTFLMENAEASSLKCPCEAFEHHITPHPLSQCTECNYTCCALCKGNPTHQYSQVTLTRPDPTAIRDSLLHALPACCQFSTLSGKTFKLSKLRRLTKWVAEYHTQNRSHKADMILEPGVGLVWSVYSLSDKELDPVLVVKPDGVYQRTGYKSYEMKLKGECYTEPWPVQIGVEVGTPEVPSVLKVSRGVGMESDAEKQICGEYKLLPTCGGPCGMLFRRVGGDSFFFPDLTQLGSPETDSFCFAKIFERTPVSFRRQRIAATTPGWKLTDEPQTVTMRSPQYKKSSSTAPGVSFNHGITVYNPTKPPQVVLEHCTTTFTVTKIVLSMPLTSSTEWTPCYTDDVSWAVGALTLPAALSQWADVMPTTDLDPALCDGCNPEKPKVGPSGVEDGREAALYEQALKSRPSAFVVEKRLITNNRTELRVCLSPSGMIHRSAAVLYDACSRLHLDNCTYSWRLVSNEDVPEVNDLQLKGNKTDLPYKTPPTLNKPYVLRKEQLRSLSWMVDRELDQTPFVRQEVATGTVGGWSLEGKTCSPILVQGGVLADEVGYGKTVVSLSLISSTHTGPPPILKDCRGRARPNSAATMVVIPPHLMGQWPSEIEKFLPAGVKVMCLQTKSDLDAATPHGLCNCDIVLLSTKLLGGVRLGLKASAGDVRQYQAEYDKLLTDPYKLKSLKLEHIVWKRIIIDEYTFLTHEQSMVVSALSARFRWLLSGTPDISSFGEVKKIGDLMQVHLGVTEQLKLTNAEKFHKLRMVEPPTWHAHRNNTAQRFLDIFVRKNVAEIDELPINIQTKTYGLSKVHSVVYQELVTTTQMSTPEAAAEVLLSGAASYKRSTYTNLLSTRVNSVGACKKDLEMNLSVALGIREAIRGKFGDKGYNGKFENWEQGAMAGDAEAAEVISSIIKKSKPKKAKVEGTGEEMKFNLDEQTHKVRSIAGSLVNNMRSVRFMKQAVAQRVWCDACDVKTHKDKLSISSMCGHVVHTSHIDSRQDAGQDCCPVEGCAALVKPQYLYSFEKLNEKKDDVQTKLQETLSLVKEILDSNTDEQVVIYVQFPTIATLLITAFKSEKIPLGVIDTPSCLETLASFSSRSLRVLLLTLDVNSSGLNLVSARNAIFFHPIFAPTPVKYLSLQRQAIGRIHRYGQEKEVRVWHMLADKTIDTKIFHSNKNIYF